MSGVLEEANVAEAEWVMGRPGDGDGVRLVEA